MGISRGKKFYSSKDIQQFSQFDKKTVEGIVSGTHLKATEYTSIGNDNRYSISDWLKARRKYLMTQPNSWRD